MPRSNDVSFLPTVLNVFHSHWPCSLQVFHFCSLSSSSFIFTLLKGLPKNIPFLNFLYCFHLLLIPFLCPPSFVGATLPSSALLNEELIQ